jgi:hypothetical protein
MWTLSVPLMSAVYYQPVLALWKLPAFVWPPEVSDILCRSMLVRTMLLVANSACEAIGALREKSIFLDDLLT